jgi:chromosomal replication initiator protein
MTDAALNRSEVDAVWQAVLGEIELSISAGNYFTWFKNTRILRANNEIVTIGVTNIFGKEQLEAKYSQLIRDMLAKNGLTPDTIEFKPHSNVPSKKTRPDTKDDDTVILGQKITSTPQHSEQSAPSVAHTYRQGLNEKYTFDSFVVGGGSELAFAACQAVADNPGTKYNPLFVYGGVGIGKTHLIQAVGNEILHKDASKRVVYITSEQFVQEFIDAVRYRKASEFANHYRTADVLIIDDIQFISTKEKTQEEFFHTFNALQQANKQIILSSDQPPHTIATLEDRLKSRLAMGMTVDMQAPDYETRCAIISAKSDQHGLAIPYEVAEYIANFPQTNVRELEGLLNQLIAFCEMRSVLPSLGVAQDLLGGRSRPKHITAKQIIERTAKYFSISVDDITGAKRDKDIVVPRQIAMYLLRTELHLSFPKITRELGRKDHTTAMHSVEKIGHEINYDADLRQCIGDIRERLYV